MNEIRYRARRWLFGPPAWSTWTPADRSYIRELSALIKETDDPAAPVLRKWVGASGRIYITRQQDRDGLELEMGFRRHARLSGERACVENHEHEHLFWGSCCACKAVA